MVLHNLLIKKKKKMKFETAKEELPISKFKKIHELEVKHGVELGKPYSNDTSAGVMIDFQSLCVCVCLFPSTVEGSPD